MLILILVPLGMGDQLRDVFTKDEAKVGTVRRAPRGFQVAYLLIAHVVPSFVVSVLEYVHDLIALHKQHLQKVHGALDRVIASPLAGLPCSSRALLVSSGPW